MTMTDKNEAGLYIHIPFCKSKCPYCDFYSFIPKNDIKDRYTESVINHIKDCGMKFDTVYFGGGTPSQLGAGRIAEILGNVDFSDNAEITVECNPSDTGSEKSDFDFNVLYGAGVNRISMGLQSAVDSERKSLGRIAGCDEVKRAMERCFKAGIDNISLDLMLGVPGQTENSLDTSLDFCTSSGASHISAYILKIEENTFFGKNRDKLILPDDDEAGDMYLKTVKRLESKGFKQYEISNFALPGKESRHNLKYWKSEEYLGIGPAAHSFINGKRFYYPPDIEYFMSGKPAVDDGDGGDEEEYIMLALRLKEGLSGLKYKEKFGHTLPEKIFEYAAFLQSKGLAETNNETISLTAEGFLISNSIICNFIGIMEERNG